MIFGHCCGWPRGEEETAPSAAVIDSRTLQSTQENGKRAGYDGYKCRKGSKVHIAVDTLDHLLALYVTSADVQDRSVVAEVKVATQEATGQSVTLAYVDQGYTEEAPAKAAQENRIELHVVKLPRAKKELRPVAQALGRRAQLCLSGPLSPPCP